jgi:flagellar operon protein (TIGR03826 family)
MGELMNCSNCDRLFVKNKFRDVCDVCYKEEEKAFDIVYNFIRKKENRTASMAEVVAKTGVEEKLIIKFIKSGRIKLTHLPNLGYPCDHCGATIREGRLCEDCTNDIRSQIQQLEAEQERERELKERNRMQTYYVQD